MAKLNLNKPIVDETGKQVMPDSTIGKAVGSILIKSVSSTEGDILKYFSWAQKLGEGKEIELDEADAKLLKKFIVEHPEMFIIVKAPAISEIDKLKF